MGVLANMYAVISPLIMPLCAVYFALAAGVYRWLFTNVYSEEFDSAGAFWQELFTGSMFGLLLGVLSLCGIAGLRGTSKPYFLGSWLLPLFIIWFKYRCDKYSKYAAFMPLEDAVAVDRGARDKVIQGFTADFYMDPIAEVVKQMDLEDVDSS